MYNRLSQVYCIRPEGIIHSYTRVSLNILYLNLVRYTYKYIQVTECKRIRRLTLGACSLTCSLYADQLLPLETECNYRHQNTLKCHPDMLLKCPLLILNTAFSPYQTAPHGADWSQYYTVCYRDVQRKLALQ